ETGSTQQPGRNQYQDPQNDAGKQFRPVAVVHSTHSHLETFDQATREQNNNTATSNNNNKNENSLNQTLRRSSSSSEQNINSALQLDRDLQQSRRVADDDRQK
ncbi:hypothetical protein BX616_009042, partial [Lobosporangium transversale]